MFLPGVIFKTTSEEPDLTIRSVSVTARTAPELKKRADRELAAIQVLDPEARVVGFTLSGGGAGDIFTCTFQFYFSASPGTELLAQGVAAKDCNVQFFEAGRGEEINDQATAFIVNTLAVDSNLVAVDTAGAAAGAVFMLGLLFTSDPVTSELPVFQTGTVSLTAGAATVATKDISSEPNIQLFLDTPGGTLGVHYRITSITPGTPGSFTINAVDTAGAVASLDTSTVRYYIWNGPIIG